MCFGDARYMTENVEIDGNVVEVDKGMVDVIKALNMRGFKTVSCCSGLRDDHRTQKSIGHIPSVNVVGRRLELIEIAEASGWDWSLNGKVSYDKDGRPISYVNYSSSEGCVYKIVAGPKGFEQTLSSKKEAIRSQLSFEFTTLLLETEDSTKDVFIRRRIAHLLETIVQLSSTREPDNARYFADADCIRLLCQYR